MTMVGVLSELECDALTELVNIGVGRAAASLRTMVGRQVLLSVPSIEVISSAEAGKLISEREADELVAIKQDFSGAFSGRAMLVFPQANGLELVRAVTGDELSAEEVAELAGEALAETGNVILNSCLGTMANMLGQSLSMTLPTVFHAHGGTLFNHDHAGPGDHLVLFLYINFSVRDRNIRGYIAMLMDLPSIGALQELIQDFITVVMGETAGAEG